MPEPTEPNQAPAPKRRRSLAYRLGRIALVVGLVGVGVRIGGCAERVAYFPTREDIVSIIYT